MKSIYCPALFFILFIVACKSKPAEKNEAASIVNTINTPFTDTLKLDTFKVSLQGINSKNSKLVFKIISYKGKEIYSTNIKGTELVKENNKLTTEQEKMEFLKNEVHYFFDEEHFLWPAVMPNEQPDKNVPDKIFYEELKLTQLNGFNYRLGKEAKAYIAWSEKEQKVKIFYRTYDTF